MRVLGSGDVSDEPFGDKILLHLETGVAQTIIWYGKVP